MLDVHGWEIQFTENNAYTKHWLAYFSLFARALSVVGIA